MPGSVKSFRNVEINHDGSKIAQTTAAASTLPELISTIPRAYQALLGDYLTKKFRAAHKHANVNSTISLYERHLTDNSFPPLVRNSLKEPKLQFAKEFLATSKGAGTPEEFRASVEEARRSVLKAAIKHKKEELALMQGLITTDKETWQERITTVSTSIAQSNGGGREQGADGKFTFKGLPALAKQEHNLLWDAADTYTFRCLALARASIDRADLQKLSKMKLKESTDVEMTDVGKEQPVRDIIREELKALKAEFASKIANGKKSNGRVTKTSNNRKQGNAKTKGKRSQKKKSR